MPFAGMHRAAGPKAVLFTFQTVHKFWTVDGFEPQQILGNGDHVAVFGSFPLTQGNPEGGEIEVGLTAARAPFP